MIGATLTKFGPESCKEFDQSYEEFKEKVCYFFITKSGATPGYLCVLARRTTGSDNLGNHSKLSIRALLTLSLVEVGQVSEEKLAMYLPLSK